MEKKDIADRLVEEYNMTKKDALAYINTIFDCMRESLAKEEEVDIFGFGRFSVIERKPHVGMNPRTKEKMDIGATKGVKFRASKILKDAVK